MASSRGWRKSKRRRTSKPGTRQSWSRPLIQPAPLQRIFRSPDPPHHADRNASQVIENNQNGTRSRDTLFRAKRIGFLTPKAPCPASFSVHRKRAASRKSRRRSELFLNPEKLIVLCDPVGARSGARLDLSVPHGHGE